MIDCLRNFLLLLCLAGALVISEATDYCKIAKEKCKKDHARCTLKGEDLEDYHDSPSHLYDGRVAMGKQPLNKKQIKEILDFHNNLRRKVANGEETRVKNGPLPRSGCMPDLVWDDELAYSAQITANDIRVDLVNTWRCADTEEYEVGENRGYPTVPNKSYDLNLKAIMSDWENGVRHFNATYSDNYKHNPKASQYTQMISGNTERIGCGARVWHHDSILYTVNGQRRRGGYQQRLFCYYASRGNIENQPVYDVFDHGKVVFHTEFENNLEN